MIAPAFSTTRGGGTRSFGPVAVEKLAEVGIDLLEWQAEVLDQLLEVDGKGRLTRTTAGIVIPRRQGKSLLIVARCLFGMLYLDERRVTYSAHMADSAREAFETMLRVVEHPNLSPRLKGRPLRAEGRELLRFDNGATFTVRTRTGHGGRGLETDLLILDEALVLEPEAVAALTPLTATAAKRGRGQVIYASSAGTLESRVLCDLRDRGREAAGTAGDGLAYFEWSTERSEDPLDVETWRRANPSLGTLITEDYLRDAQKRLSAEAFGREHLGWFADTTGLPVIDPEKWSELAAARPPKKKGASAWMTFDCDHDRTALRVLRFYRSTDDRIAVQVVDAVDDPTGIADDLLTQRVLGMLAKSDPDVVGSDRYTT